MQRVVPSLWGGARGGRRPVFVGLGEDDLLASSFNPSVEAWRSDIASAAGDLPVPFLLMWIQKESNGNPCSWTSLSEAGIFQLMAGDNIAQGRTTLAQQHPSPPCVQGVQTTAYRSNLTDEQARWQVEGGLTYVRYCRDHARQFLSAAGYNWSESDWSFWAVVKMVHVAPGYIPGMLQAGIDGYGGVPPDWLAMTAFVNNVPANWLDNAYQVGLYGQGGGSVLGALTSNKYLALGLMGAAAVALVMLSRRQSRRIVG